MTNHGDDCYFYYYSTCAKGDSCPFRHCEAAMGSEVECSLWQENRCFRPGCMFRHMKIKKNRKEIPCYWEKQPSGCQKPHCAFYHEKSRLFTASNKGPAMKKDGEDEPMQEEPASSAPNPQLRGVKKADTQENVPSPTHPPVVINPVDDEDEDEDDQFSEEGEDRSKMSSPRKLIIGPKDDSLNFGVRTLEEIRLRKALKANLKKAEAAGFVIPGQPNNGSTGEKENMRSIRRPALFTAKNRPEEASKLRITDRLEKRTLNDDTAVEGELPLKRSLAQRLGGKVDASEEDPDQPSQRGTRSMRERLGLSVESGSAPSPAAPSQPGPPGQIRIKTLEEIRQEKAAKSQERASASPPKTTTKTVSQTLLAKRKQEAQKRKVQVVKETASASTQQGKEAPEAAPAGKPSAPTQPSSGVRVKTLEEIRREKAARLGAQDQSSAPVPEGGGGGAPRRRILRIIKPSSPASTEVKVQKPTELPEKPKDNGSDETVANGKAAAPAVEKVRPDSSTAAVKVKTFEEIMREKQLRKQEQEAVQSQATVPATPAQKQSVTGATTPMPSQPGPAPARQRITVKAKVAPAKLAAAPTIHTAEPSITTTTTPKDLPMSLVKKPRIAAAPAPATKPPPVQQTPDVDTAQPDPPVSVMRKLRTTAASAATPNPSTVQQTPDSNTAQPDLPVSLAKKAKVAAAAAAPAPAPVPDPAPAPAPNPLPVQQIPVVDTPQPDTAPKTSPLKKSPENKVKPKVNVKPVVKASSVKPSAHVRPGQKRKAAAGQGSAVAAVKPLSAAATAEEAPELQEPPCKRSEASITAPPSTLEAVATQSPLQGPTVSSSFLEGNTVQQNDEPQTVPVFEQSPATTITSSSVETLMAVPQSPSVPKTPSQTRARKGSTTTPRITSTASSTSAVDDFEELINEFEMDDEVDLEPDKGEDDLLLELSEMIGS